MPADTPTLRYDPDLAPGYWTPARSDFLRTPAFSPQAKLLYLILCSYAGQGVTAWPGKARLAAEMPCGVRTLDGYVAELVRGGLLTVKQRGQGLTNLYYLHRLPTLDRQNPPVLKSKIRRPKGAELAAESDVSESESGERTAPPIQAIDAFAYQDARRREGKLRLPE